MSNKIENLKKSIENKARTLSAKWSISSSITNVPSHIQEELAEILSEEINNEILFETYTKDGWFHVTKPDYQVWNIDEIANWCTANCVKKYHIMRHVCLFQDKEDAINFNLTWC